MAFKTGNRARKKESAAQTTESVNLSTLKYCVGDYTRKIDKCCMDRLRAAVYYHRHQEKSEDKYDDEKLEEEDEFKKISKEDIAKESLAILQAKKYCFNPIIRKIFAGDITDFVAYPYPVNCGLKLNPDEKELLIEINNFKCSFMEETMGNLYLSTKIILSNEEIPEGIFDWLGYYTKHIFTNPDQVEPEVWLLINKIEAESISLGCDRKYILAKVYIHEMMHRYYDMHPELLLKKSVKEIEEPMAEFATIKFCEEFCKDHVEHNELLNVAINQTNSLRKTKHYIYALGANLYDFKYSTSLINEYRHTCMMMHKDNDPVKKYETIVNGQKANYNKKERNDEAAETLCDALENCIEEYNR